MKKLHHLEMKNLRFSVFSSKNIRSLSVAKVVTPLLFDQLGHALPGGLYDAKMGPFSINSDPCATCYRTLHCNGHMGHIELSMLVYNPIFVKIVYDILRITCFNCFRLQISDNVMEILVMQLRLLDAGYIIEAQEIEIFKSDVVVAQSKEEKDEKLEEYKRLIETGLNSCDVVENSKNLEALRTSIVSNSVKNNPNKRCIHCKEALKKVKYSFRKLMLTAMKSEYDSELNDSHDARGRPKTVSKALLADECRDYMRRVYEMHEDVLKMLYPVLLHAPDDIEHAIDIFFMDTIPVPPPLVRPANKFQNEIREHPQTTILKNIVEANILLKAICSHINDTVSETQLNETQALFDSASGDTPYEKMYNAWQKLQLCVDQTWDSAFAPNTHGVQGLKQVLEKKTGIIRLHMMGKRVNYAARTVITPDPFINVDEIGLPEVFARKLSYPVRVTSWNVAELRKMVINGPNVHPGANFIEDEVGRTLMVPANDQAKRESLAKTLMTPTEKGVKTVHRHLLNGDVMLLNRQPTLHRNSIMAHKVRILRGEKTFRMHYSNCKSYNADFDGDEMNAHAPQNDLARSEAYNLLNVANQYLVAKDGTPLGGLIQDHVISGVKMSMRGRFFNREDYQQLVFTGLAHISKEITFLPPTILKPIRLWSGKQILSTILMNIIPPNAHRINLKSTAKTSVKSWQTEKERPWLAGGTMLKDIDMTESEVVIRGGELLVGVLDKTHYGATPYGLIHCMYELYGGNVSTQLLSSFSKVFTIFLQREGFTLGVRDILVLPDADKMRHKVIKKTRKIGPEAVAIALELPIETPFEILAEKMSEAIHSNPTFRSVLDRAYKSTLDSYTNRINKICLPAGLLCKFPDNNLQLMVGSGAKGSTVNTMQISCCLGQIELEGKRPPMMISGRTLPCFPEFEMCPKAGGFIDGRFMTGIQPQDFFFHCMAGREGLIDTAVKTSRSGYLQRCLIKHLEGLKVEYDMTVRDSDNSVIQFMYGEDGMDVSKSQFLKTKQFPFLLDNIENIIPSDEFLEKLKNFENYDSIMKSKKRLRSWRKKNPIESKRHETGFQRFSREILSEIEINNPNKLSKKTGRRKIDAQIVKLWTEADEEQKAKYSKKCTSCPDPVVSRYQPDCNFSSMPEHLESLMVNYMKNLNIDFRTFEDVVAVKTSMSFASAGEPVGLLAAQSIGEPSTQMTLNTFHFAGRGEMNVTLGIPRLREILMFATENIKTPSLDIPFRQQLRMEEHAEHLRKKMARVTLADVLESINVQSHIVLRPNRVKNYCVRFNFLPREAYEQDFAVTPRRILRHMRESFFKLMFKTISKAASEKYSSVDIGSEEKKKKTAEEFQDRDIDEREPETAGAGNNESSDDEAIGDDDDATAVKLKSKAMDECDYDEAAVEEGEKEASDNESDVEVVEGENAAATADAEQDEKEKIIGLESNEYNTQYRTDSKHHLWCELTFQLGMTYKNVDLSIVLKDVAHKSVVSEVPLIKRAITYNKDNDIYLKTDGINITEMFKHMEVLDLNRLYTNQIHAMAQTYGIEAAARVVVKEVQQVFQVYGITVDPRHLLLIADYMTFDGTFKPLSRSGIESSASPLQQMSFESTLKFLKSAIVKSQLDSLGSPSSCLMVGQPCKSGTGAFTCLTDNSFILKHLMK